MAHSGHEIEIKLRVESIAKAQRMLRAAGFQISKRRVFESNVIYDTPELRLRAESSLVRVRRAGKAMKLTFKGAPVQARHKSREELEIDVSNADTMGAILERLGLRPVFRYDKFRAEYKRARGAGVATLDETPIGNFLELEGEPDWIDGMAQRLGFQESDYILASYGRLYRDWCEREGCTPGDMVFPAARGH